MDLSFDEIDDLFDTDFNNEDFGIDSEYFENEEYIDDEINKPLEVKPLVKQVNQVKPQEVIKPILKPILKPQVSQVKQEVKERQNMSYDDILKSMNVTVVNGKLVLSKGTSNNVETGRNQIENTQTKRCKSLKNQFLKK